jgi:putative nucleotidyltransferase with HDIG domain
MTSLCSPAQIESPNTAIRYSEILSAFSFALDLTESATNGHAVRSCLLGMRIADCAQISAEERRSLYYALLLKDVGCSSNSARVCQIVGGDERVIKAGVKLEDWTQPHKPRRSALSLLWNNVLPEANPFQRAARIGQIALSQHKNNEEMITLRCDRGASIVRKLGLGDAAAEAVRGLDEHWNGSGYPGRRTGHTIPLLARICAVAQHLDVFATEHGPERAMQILEDRSGTWFDPELVRITQSLHVDRSLWAGSLAGENDEDTRRRVMDCAPPERDRLACENIDSLCEAFADVVDTKSPFTYRHSMGVTDAANSIAERMGLPLERRRLVRRASLLHDLGKLGVSNAILDKPGKLTREEWNVVQGHPGLTCEILSRVSAFQELALIAGEHHEKLDGSGYPHRKTAGELCIESRIIAVADVYGALAEDRPYRASLELRQILAIMEREVPHRLDPDCFDVLREMLLQR